MSRQQADAVALANDQRGWPSPTARHNPFTNATFVKNAIASGSITPPIGESASVRRSDWITGVCVVCFIALGAAAFLLAMLWRH